MYCLTVSIIMTDHKRLWSRDYDLRVAISPYYHDLIMIFQQSFNDFFMTDPGQKWWLNDKLSSTNSAGVCMYICHFRLYIVQAGRLMSHQLDHVTLWCTHLIEIPPDHNFISVRLWWAAIILERNRNSAINLFVVYKAGDKPGEH